MQLAVVVLDELKPHRPIMKCVKRRTSLSQPFSLADRLAISPEQVSLRQGEFGVRGVSLETRTLTTFPRQSVVFLMFWQSSCLGLLFSFGLVKPTRYWSAEDLQTGILA
jgi:hypothetical protein